MSLSMLFLLLVAYALAAYWLGRRVVLGRVDGDARRLHSLPRYHGYRVALLAGLPPLVLLVLWLAFDQVVIGHLVMQSLPESMRALSEAQRSLLLNDIRNLATGNIASSAPDPALTAAVEHYRRLSRWSNMALPVLLLLVGLGGLGWGLLRVYPGLRARASVERVVHVLLLASASIAILTTLGIVLSVLFEALRFFESVPLGDFLFGLEWSPQIAIRADQVGASGAFGMVPLFAGTLMIAGIALAVAVPVGLFSAIWLAEFAGARARAWIKPLLEILAGIPTVVYGFFAALVVAPLVRGLGESLGLAVSSESALAAGLVMGVMIIPFVSSLSDDVITAVPQSLRDGSLALGATPAETVLRVVLPAALPGIVGGVLLAASRAIGETMIVVMAAGVGARLTANPLDSVTTITVQIVTLLVGDQEFDSPKTLAAFALGLVLFLATLLLNVLALYVVRRYREAYE